MVAVRSVDDVLVSAVTVIISLYEPDDWETVSQDASPLLTFQLVLEVIVNDCCSLAELKLNEAGETVKTGMYEACVTEMVRVISPAVTVMVAVRWDGESAVTVVMSNIASLEPEVGETVNHVASPMLTVQFVLDVMVITSCSLVEEKLNEAGDTDKIGSNPACVTVTVFFGTPVKRLQLNVTVAFRGEVDVFAAAVIHASVPVTSDTVSHGSSLSNVQLSFEVMVIFL